MYILAGKKKLQKLEKEEIPKLAGKGKKKVVILKMLRN